MSRALPVCIRRGQPSVRVVYPSNRYLTARVRAFADFVAETLAAAGWWERIATTDKASAGARRNT